MRIAQVAPLYEAVPPKLYGGTERVIANLCAALTRLGHDVTLFASGDSEAQARLVACRDRAIRLDPAPYSSDTAAHLAMLRRVRRFQDQFDVIHFHTDLVHLPLFEDIAWRTVTTLHGRLDMKDLAAAYEAWPMYPLVSISRSQTRPMPKANWIGTVHHGLRPELFRLGEGRGGYLAFLGRMCAEKGPDRAIAIAKRLGLPLKLAAKIDPNDRQYFQEVVRPLLGHPLIDFVGEISDHEKSDFLGGAMALLFPIAWPEPFGLVMIEATACGTPVIAFDRGSAAEVIEDGVTGFVVSGVDEAVEAVEAAKALDRRAIRGRFECRYTSAAMAAGYLRIYERLASRQPPFRGSSGWRREEASPAQSP